MSAPRFKVGERVRIVARPLDPFTESLGEMAGDSGVVAFGRPLVIAQSLLVGNGSGLVATHAYEVLFNEGEMRVTIWEDDLEAAPTPEEVQAARLRRWYLLYEAYGLKRSSAYAFATGQPTTDDDLGRYAVVTSDDDGEVMTFDGLNEAMDTIGIALIEQHDVDTCVYDLDTGERADCHVSIRVTLAPEGEGAHNPLGDS